jgi:hypothetical protein
MDGVHR